MPSKKAKANRPAGKAAPRGPSLLRERGREAKAQNVPA